MHGARHGHLFLCSTFSLLSLIHSRFPHTALASELRGLSETWLFLTLLHFLILPFSFIPVLLHSIGEWATRAERDVATRNLHGRGLDGIVIKVREDVSKKGGSLCSHCLCQLGPMLKKDKTPSPVFFRLHLPH